MVFEADIDVVRNTGAIFGDVEFGANDDVYDGRGGGVVVGVIKGGDGDDPLKGSSAVDAGNFRPNQMANCLETTGRSPNRYPKSDILRGAVNQQRLLNQSRNLSKKADGEQALPNDLTALIGANDAIGPRLFHML